jgi:hypothetical protein
MGRKPRTIDNRSRVYVERSKIRKFVNTVVDTCTADKHPDSLCPGNRFGIVGRVERLQVAPHCHISRARFSGLLLAHKITHIQGLLGSVSPANRPRPTRARYAQWCLDLMSLFAEVGLGSCSALDIVRYPTIRSCQAIDNSGLPVLEKQSPCTSIVIHSSLVELYSDGQARR